MLVKNLIKYSIKSIRKSKLDKIIYGRKIEEHLKCDSTLIKL